MKNDAISLKTACTPVAITIVALWLAALICTLAIGVSNLL